mmetsp:Transcript_72699/g.115086  ORF Transcript_72699/g.115086 Transcript_72699/m.115086 type:complete len:207 (-) Transcript_72699:327-947(-)
MPIDCATTRSLAPRSRDTDFYCRTHFRRTTPTCRLSLHAKPQENRVELCLGVSREANDPGHYFAIEHPLLHGHGNICIPHHRVEDAVPLLLCEVCSQVSLGVDEQAATTFLCCDRFAILTHAKELFDRGGVRHSVLADHMQETIDSYRGLLCCHLQQMRIQVVGGDACVIQDEFSHRDAVHGRNLFPARAYRKSFTIRDLLSSFQI